MQAMTCAEKFPREEDSTFESSEFEEYEREFKQYTAENLRTLAPEVDFASELQDDSDTLRSKLLTLAAWWREARHVVVFTGAGISTAAGLPDYRGPQGIWTRKIRGEGADDGIAMFTPGSLTPTLAHQVVVRLFESGHVASVVTTNVDGLHLASGFPRGALSELHGNACIEECRVCSARFTRDYVTRVATSLFEHATGRQCEHCGEALYDNIVNFGNTFEHVPSMEAEHDRAWVECMKADLCVVLGSSLSVQTACDLPEECLAPRCDKPAGGRLVVVNLQRTPKDTLASLSIFATSDTVLSAVEQELLPRAKVP